MRFPFPLLWPGGGRYGQAGAEAPVRQRRFRRKWKAFTKVRTNLRGSRSPDSSGRSRDLECARVGLPIGVLKFRQVDSTRLDLDRPIGSSKLLKPCCRYGVMIDVRRTVHHGADV